MVMATGRELIRAMAIEAGFVRARFLAPFEPPAGVPAGRSQGSPALLTVALPYGNRFGCLEAAPPPGAGLIAPFARRNYYREAVKRLQGIAAALRARFGGGKPGYQILCNSPVPEKPLALASGLGVLGRNGLVLTEEAGSLVILAAMTLPFTLEGDESQPRLAGGGFPLCTACAAGGLDALPCRAACPTGALNGDGSMDAERCIQWYASGKGEAVPPLVRECWGNRLYGCTACQDACVHNRRPIAGTESAEGPLPAFIGCRELLALDDGEIRAFFKGSVLGGAWLGPAAIRRNAGMIIERGLRPRNPRRGAGGPPDPPVGLAPRPLETTRLANGGRGGPGPPAFLFFSKPRPLGYTASGGKL